MTTNQCTAKSKRTGVQCKAKGMPNGKCYHHGGKSTGAPKGNKFAATHGVYSRSFTTDESDLAQTAIGSLDQELILARVQLSRALKAEANASALPDRLELAEITTTDAGYVQRKSIKRDYYQIINTLLGRIESLEKSRQTLLTANPSAEQSAKTIICPDE